MNEKKTVSLEILSEVYNIKSDIPEAELFAMRDVLNEKMKNIKEKASYLSFQTIAVLAALELVKEKMDLEKAQGELDDLLKDEKLIF